MGCGPMERKKNILTKEQKRNYVLFMFHREVAMIRILFRELAALSSVGLFLAMIGTWAGVIGGA